MTKASGTSRGLLTLVALAIGLSLAVTFANRGLIDLARVTGEHDNLAAELASIKERNQRLLVEVERLKTDPAALEEVARRELGLAKPREMVYLFNPTVGEDKNANGRSPAGD